MCSAQYGCFWLIIIIIIIIIIGNNSSCGEENAKKEGFIKYLQKRVHKW